MPLAKYLNVGSCNHISNLEGIPSELDSLSLRNLPNLNNLDFFPEVIHGNFTFNNCPGITNMQLLRAAVGSVVNGSVEGNFDKHFHPQTIDKKLYTREYRDELERGSKEAGANLDF